MTISGEWPTDEEIREIARNEDIPLSAEAYEISQQYHNISQALCSQLGHDDLNWCGFAQWSSKAVGSQLRLGNNSRFVQKLSRLDHIPLAVEPLFRLFLLAFLGGSYGTGLSTANRTIFVEMASFHTGFLSGSGELTILQVSPPAGVPSLIEDLGAEGQDLLRTAHSLLDRARSASGQLRSELILGANIALSAYEQKRVQPALQFVFYRPVRWALQVSWRMPYYYVTGKSSERFCYYSRPHEEQPPTVRWLESQWVRKNSKTLWIKTAIDTIRLALPLANPQGHHPPMLRAASTFQVKDVADLVQRFGPANTEDLKGVVNWLDYDERMHFITAYFMTYQQIEQMFCEPHFRRKQYRIKPHSTGPLGVLQIRKMTLSSRVS